MSSTRNILLVGTFLYILLAPFFFHPDIKTIFYLSQFLKDGVFNIYQFIAQNPDKAFLGPFVYPPLTYFLFGILFLPVSIFSGLGFVEWLSQGNDALGSTHIFQYIFVMKLPLILVHVATGYLLTKFFVEVKKKTTVLLVWMFNPISIYIVALMGQFDGIPAFLTLWSLFTLRKKPFWAAIALGFAAAIKSYPLFLLPFLAIAGAKERKKQVALFVIGLVPYLAFVLPFTGSKEFYGDTIVSGLSQRIFQLAWPLGFGEYILLVPAAILLLFFVSLSKDSGNVNSALRYFLAIPLVIVAGSHFHPQWTLWSLPFLAIALVRSKQWAAGVLLVLGWFGTVFLFNDIFLIWGLFGPIDSGVLFIPTSTDLVKKFSDPLLMQSIFHTVFTVSAFWITWNVFKEKSV
ncbi:MAG: glycosyltransferase 87 family protein [bacterium]|nr:glycosyltransferase 87 family protein [bacterium]